MPAKHLLRLGNNTLQLVIHSARAYAQQQAAAYPYELVPPALQACSTACSCVYISTLSTDAERTHSSRKPCCAANMQYLTGQANLGNHGVMRIPYTSHPLNFTCAAILLCALTLVHGQGRASRTATTSSASRDRTLAGTGALALQLLACMALPSCMPTALPTSQV